MTRGIFIATPCFGGMVESAHMLSCLALKENLSAIGMDHTWLTLSNESLIARARNVCAASFLNESDLSHLLFIDADIEFSPDDVARLMIMCEEQKAHVAVGAYRMKKPGAALAAWRDGQLSTVQYETKPFKVDYAGTGFMLIPRKTLEKLAARKDFVTYTEGQVGACGEFFNTPIVDGCMLSEDYFFCKQVRDAGMSIWCDPLISLKHWGKAAY